jgi:SAM-dependent methyltransferase
MVHRFDSEKTARFFNETFPKLVAPKIPHGLRHRDKILLRYILEPRRDQSPKILDFGCGQGNLLGHLVREGFDATGMEPSEDMRRHAAKELEVVDESGNIIAGGVPEFSFLPSQSFDVIIMMGVFQYLSDDDYKLMRSEIARVLRPGGCLVATFQNAFFDLYTFNKYTIDFIMHQLIGPLIDVADSDAIENALSRLVANPEKPPYSPDRARDNIFVRLTNPLAIGDEFIGHGLKLAEKYFYEWFGLPPLLDTKYSNVSKPIAKFFEVERAASWQGHFMANAFLAEFTKG